VTEVRQRSPCFLYELHFRFQVVTNTMFFVVVVVVVVVVVGTSFIHLC
jgi:hypothetical protein